MPFLFQLSHQVLGRIDRDGETDTLAAGKNGRVDPHHFPFQVDQRPAAVSRVDGGIGLNEIIIGARADHPALGADDPGGNRALQAEGIADGHYPIADPEFFRIAQFDRW